MNLSKVNSYAQYSQQSSRYSDTRRTYQCFDPHTSELYQMFANFSKQVTTQGKEFWLIQLDRISNYKAGQMIENVANFIENFRSFVLGMLKGAMKISFCKNEKDARRLSNLGGSVVCIKNQGEAIQWGVVK